MKLKYPFTLGATLLGALIIGLVLPSLADSLGVLFSYAEGLSTITCVAISVVAASVAFFLYRRSQELMPRYASIGLGTFRYLVILLVALLLLEPRLETKQKLSSPPVIAVLHDNTESMVIHRDSQFVKEEYPLLLKSFTEKLNTEKVNSHFFGFSQNLEADLKADSLSYKKTGTNISGALEEAGKIFANQNLGALVLISDGIATSGTNPIYTLDQFQLPIYTVLLGDTTPHRDLKITDVLYNQIAYLENETPIKVKIDHDGYESGNVTVTIRGEGKVQGSQNINLSASSDQIEVDFMVKPSQTGVVQYSISVSPLEGEITTRNNYHSIFINVLETKVKVALLAGYPHPDVGALRSAFTRDDRYEVTEFIHKTGSSFYRDPSLFDFKDFDLFILHNFPFNQRDAQIIERVKKEVTDRKVPLMTFVGKNTQVNLLSKSLGKYMAIIPGSVVNTVEEAQLNFKDEYRNHSTYSFEDKWINLMNSAPPLFRNQSEWKANGDAKILATARIKGIALDYPIYGLQNHLGRKNMVFVGENLWRTRAHAYTEGKDFAHFDQWIYNNIQWLIVKEDKRKFKVQPSKKLFSGQEPVLFRGEAYDDSYNPLPGVDIKLSITAPDGKENVHYLKETQDAHYFLELMNLEQGTYNYEATGTKNEVQVGSDRGQFSIGRSNIEHFRLTADKPLMQQIALRTGGKFVHAREMEALADEILKLNSLKPVVSYVTKRLGFNEYQWIFYIVLVLLALEWVIRKRYSLS